VFKKEELYVYISGKYSLLSGRQVRPREVLGQREEHLYCLED
jgi:hypothetical protein